MQAHRGGSWGRRATSSPRFSEAGDCGPCEMRPFVILGNHPVFLSQAVGCRRPLQGRDRCQLGTAGASPW